MNILAYLRGLCRGSHAAGGGECATTFKVCPDLRRSLSRTIAWVDFRSRWISRARTLTLQQRPSTVVS